jgi:hypothetical protein
MVKRGLPSDMAKAEVNKKIAISQGLYSIVALSTGITLTKMLPTGRNRNFIYFINTAYIVVTIYSYFIYHHPSLYLAFSVILYAWNQR